MKRSRVTVLSGLMMAVLMIAVTAWSGQIKLSNEVAWVKAADAYKCMVQQAYANAMNRLRNLVKDQKPGTWCVVLDADETVISNVDFQVQLQKDGEDYSSSSWTIWCSKAASPALPGAKEFCDLVKELGGKVIIVTNRKGNVKGATAKNLESVGIPYDLLLVREGPYALDRSKALRRNDVEKGTVKTVPASQKLPPLKIVMLVGDQVHDLYNDKTKSFKEVKNRFGQDLVILPNPMYGDWAFQGVYVEGEKAPTAKIGAGAITWQEAMKRMDQEVVVEAKIVKVYDPETKGKGGPVKLNTDPDWRNSLTFVFYKKDQSGRDQGFPAPNSLLYKKVRIKGKVSEYRGNKQIMMQSPSDIEIVE